MGDTVVCYPSFAAAILNCISGGAGMYQVWINLCAQILPLESVLFTEASMPQWLGTAPAMPLHLTLCSKLR